MNKKNIITGKKTGLSDTVFFSVIILHYKFKLRDIFNIHYKEIFQGIGAIP